MRRVAFIFTLLMVCIFFSGAALTAAQAGTYPDRPINLIIPGTAGSIIDITGRIIGEELGKILGVKVVPMDKPGATFTLGTDFVARSKPDGYTLSYTNSGALVNVRAVKPEIVPYDVDKDLVPLGLHLFLALGVGVQASSPWKTFQDLADYAKKNPGKLTGSTSGKYPSAFFLMKILESSAGVNVTQVPYKGGKAVIAALLGGHVDTAFDAGMKFTPHVKADKLRVLLLTKKMQDFPDVPTPRDLGYNFDIPSPLFAFYAPAGIPEEVKQVLIPAIKKAVNEPVSKAKIEKMGFVVNYGTPAELNKVVADQFKEMSTIMERVRAQTK